MKSNMDIDESDARLESDEKAVKIITIHKSKGLEFPITFIPFCWKTKRSSSKKRDSAGEHETSLCCINKSIISIIFICEGT